MNDERQNGREGRQEAELERTPDYERKYVAPIIAGIAGVLAGTVLATTCRSPEWRLPRAAEIKPYVFDANSDGIRDLVLSFTDGTQTVFVGQPDGSYLNLAESMDQKYPHEHFGRRLTEVGEINERARTFVKEKRGE